MYEYQMLNFETFELKIQYILFMRTVKENNENFPTLGLTFSTIFKKIFIIKYNFNEM